MSHLPEFGDDVQPRIDAIRQRNEPRERIPTPRYVSEIAQKIYREHQELRNEILLHFYNTVCDRAEENMKETGTVSGAHWNAMRQVLSEWGIEVTR